MTKSQYLQEYYRKNRARLLRRSLQYYRKNKASIRAKQAQYRQHNPPNPEKRREISRRWNLRNPEKYLKTACESSRKYRSKYPERVRKTRKHATLKYKYGLTLEAYEALLQRQRGRCAVCVEKMSRPCVDHDHTTGVVREILCPLCNMILGSSRENKKILRAAIAYLEKHKRTNRTKPK